MAILYVVPWYDCNLNCPHCDVHVSMAAHENWRLMISNHELYLSLVAKFANEHPNSQIILWGGEPMIYPESFRRLIHSGLFKTVSTNLTRYEYIYGQWLAEANMSVATSWNPHRFNNQSLFNHWATACADLSENYGIHPLMLITMDRDLLAQSPMYTAHLISELCMATRIEEFLFEHYVGEEDLNEEADEWLCEFHDCYHLIGYSAKNVIEQRLHHWVCDFSNTYTLEPTGELRRGCPQSKGTRILSECLTCQHSSLCRPCVLQKSCSYPKKLAKKLGIWF